MTIEVRDRHEIIIRQSPDSQTNIRDASKKEVHELHKHMKTPSPALERVFRDFSHRRCQSG
jgi:hypothetical protein